jgi:hypothetical protein
MLFPVLCPTWGDCWAKYSDVCDIADGDSVSKVESGETTFRVFVEGREKSLDRSKRGGRFAVLLLFVEMVRFVSISSWSLRPVDGLFPITIGLPFRKAISRIADSDVCWEIGKGCFSGS